ncbi:murein L,D-transpeptidase catalytic domain family protein [Mucilaginibacter sp. HC2]|uniref:murein L,D-transpeptidase catalytic domain family protein n=1 Tax=Mucilaginibacter inviolabilis TaxID=2714892 RepID=UPI001408F892|nr:murein L,D-transpeptidase catalytic domain family protein [Mucilaginibacter inviolabilis]NHA02445.1 murein L,D-transpeptidase catalytic domain family protein [Mucilaginibacter inviolabilis]
MRKHLWCVTFSVLFLATTIVSWRSVGANKSDGKVNSTLNAKELFNQYVNNLYQAASLQQTGLTFDVFEKAITGYTNLKLNHQLPQSSSVLTVVDFTKSSREKRMWIIDLFSKQLLLNTWVAHGQGSGEEMATSFSDRNDSHQSSLGFYLTDKVYMGKHGRSLHLDGLDEGFNSNARMRDIVIHGASYVSQAAINHQGYLGRSFGCPAVPAHLANTVINTIKDKTVLFINGNDDSYTSKYLDETGPLNFIAADTTAFDLARL